MLIFRCSILKACFTAVFPSLIRLRQQSRSSFSSQLDGACVSVDKTDSPLSSGQSTPTKRGSLRASASAEPAQCGGQLKGILDKLLSLVQALLLQELRQSTLDEIFTLLEPYLKLSEVLSREMSITLLHATLKTFNEGKVKGNKTSECIFFLIHALIHCGHRLVCPHALCKTCRFYFPSKGSHKGILFC